MNTSASEASLIHDFGRYLRHQLRGRRGLVAAAIGLAAPALWLGWPWLVAAGMAPMLLALAPCAVMCGLGLCMGKACKKSPATAADPETAAGSVARRAIASPGIEQSTSFVPSCSDCDKPAEAAAPSALR